MVGCASSRLYYGEPVDKTNAAFVRGVFIKGFIRASQADESTRLHIDADGLWTTSGNFLVEYACLDSTEDATKVHTYPNQQTIHVEAGYHYDVECNDEKTKLILSNSAWEDFDYQSFGQAISEVMAKVRHLDDEPTDGFRYLYYNDWGGSKETNFEIYTDYNTKRLTATLTQYPTSVMYLAGEAYNRGIRKEDAMMKALKAEEFTADVADCPLLADHYAKISKAFDTRYTDGPLPSESTEGQMYLDSPPVYRYFLGKSHEATAVLTTTVEEGALYQATQTAMDYVKTCGKKATDK